MAKAEVWTKPHGNLFTHEGFAVLAASTHEGGVLLLDDGDNIIRIKLTKEEAKAVAAKISPHIP